MTRPDRMWFAVFAALAAAACGAKTGLRVSDWDTIEGDADFPRTELPLCASESATGGVTQVDLVVLLDQSGSMDQVTWGGKRKWVAVTDALGDFAYDPASSGLGIALGYFPVAPGGAPKSCVTDQDCSMWGMCINGKCSGTYDSCDVDDYADPEVAMGVLPGNAKPLATSMSLHDPGGGTPTRPALEGAIAYSRAWSLAHPGHAVAVVMATDGEPTTCGATVQNSSEAAAAGLAGQPSIRTYVLGVGFQLTNLNGIAKAGGTAKAYLVDTLNGDAQKQFAQALATIRGKALGCVHSIPGGGALDAGPLSSLRVKHTSKEGSATFIPQVPSAAACGSGGGFYVNDPVKPSNVVLCPATCQKVAATPGKITVEYGCIDGGLAPPQ